MMSTYQEDAPHVPPPSLSSVVSLNVGGTKFDTTRQTLLTDPSSMLAKMFDPVSPLQPGATSKLDTFFISSGML